MNYDALIRALRVQTVSMSAMTEWSQKSRSVRERSLGGSAVQEKGPRPMLHGSRCRAEMTSRLSFYRSPPTFHRPYQPSIPTIRRFVLQGVIAVSLLFLLWNWISTPSTSSSPVDPSNPSSSPTRTFEVSEIMSSPLKHLKVVPKDAHKATVIFLHVSFSMSAELTAGSR